MWAPGNIRNISTLHMKITMVHIRYALLALPFLALSILVEQILSLARNTFYT